MHRHRVLIVARTPALADDLSSWLGSEGYGLAVVTTFAAAKLHLQMDPTLVITELKLGEYNGLHLAVRASAQRTPVVVIGETDDAFFQHEAEQLGAIYLANSAATREQILTLARRLSGADRNEPQHPHDGVAWIDQRGVTSLQRALSYSSQGTPMFVNDGGSRRFLVN